MDSKKVLIISDIHDQSTYSVIDWLIFFDQEYLLINDNFITFKSLQITSEKVQFRIKHKGLTIDSTDIASFWYRRGRLSVAIVDYSISENSNWTNYITEEMEDVSKFLMFYLTQLNGFGNYENNKINKLQVLATAASLGLKIPNTFISTDIKEISNLAKGQTRIIKAIRHGIFEQMNVQYSLSTKIFDPKKIINWKKITCPILTQNLLEKKYELRVFYLKGEFFTTAIFSQNDEQTKIDFRNYNHNKPNRTPPYILPKEIKNKINMLMTTLSLKSGSIDIVVTTNNDFVFLEVNPVGQYNQVSKPTNYYLDRLIATLLTTKNE